MQECATSESLTQTEIQGITDAFILFFREVTGLHIAQMRARLGPCDRICVHNSVLVLLATFMAQSNCWSDHWEEMSSEIGLHKTEACINRTRVSTTSSQPAPLCMPTVRVRCTAQHRVIGRLWARYPQGHARLLPSLLGPLGTRNEESGAFWLVTVGE